MKIRVNPHNVEIVREETEPINELEVKVSKCEFEFDEKITNEFVKEAYFTLNGSTYKQIIVNNECDYPNEVLTEKGTLEIGVVAYKVENGEELIRYNPSPDYYDTWVGSLKDAENTEPLTPTDKEQMQSQISQNTSDISDLQANKQDKLTQGDNITIDENNVISAVDTIYDDTEIKADIQELQETKIDKNVNNLTYYTLTTETGSKITLSIDSSTYVMTLKLKDKNNNDISTANVDLPLETMVVGARYDSATKEIILTLKNGQEVRFSVADLVSGLQTEITENNKLSSDLVDDTNNTNKFVSAEEKAQITTNKNDITAIKDGEEIDSFADVENSLNLKEDKSNKVTEINSSSTDTQYPSAKCVYDSQKEQNEHIAELEMLYNAFPTVSAENETIQLDNTAKVKFREIDLKGNTSQVVIPEEQGTSVSNTSIYVSDVNTDKESSIEMSGNTYQETTTGKNLLNTNNIEIGTKNGITTAYNSATQEITFNGTCDTDNTQIVVSTHIIPFISGTTKVIGYYVSGSLTNSGVFRTFSSGWTNYDGVNIYQLNSSNPIIVRTTTFNADKNLFSFRFDNGAVATNFKIKLMITDSNDTTFEKFTYGASPNPDYQQNIEVVTGTQNVEVCGKNLFDKSKAVLGKRLDPTGYYYNDADYYTSPYIRVTPNIKYIKNSPSQDAYHRYCFYTKDKVFINQSTYNVYTIPSNCWYVRFCGLQSELDTTQFEQGDTSTTYEAYQGTTYPVNLGNIELCKIDTYQDRIYKSNNKWYLEKNIDKVVLNGSEDWMNRGTATTGYSRFVVSLGNNIIKTNDATEKAKIFSNKFIGISRTETYNRINGFAPSVQSSDAYYRDLVLYYSNVAQMTTEQFKIWLASNNILLYYVLATPTTTEITDTTLVNQLNALYNATIYPITNINTDTSNLLPYIDLHYNFVTPSPSPSRPSVVNVVKGNNTITISNSDNTESQNYPINLGDMELCKIDTYQDYIYESNGNWYKHSEIGKVVLNGSETWSKSANRFVCGKVASIIKPTSSNDEVAKIFSDKFVGVTINNTTQSQPLNGIAIAGSGNLVIYYDAVINFTYGEFRNWLSTNNVLVYYILETPTDTQITDTTLITQLDNIKKAYSYDTQTNISQTNTDKPFIIYAEAIRSLKDVFE